MMTLLVVSCLHGFVKVCTILYLAVIAMIYPLCYLEACGVDAETKWFGDYFLKLRTRRKNKRNIKIYGCVYCMHEQIE